METLEVLKKEILQIEWQRAHSKRIRAYREEHGKQPPFIVDRNPHEFSHAELLQMTRTQFMACNIIKELAEM